MSTHSAALGTGDERAGPDLLTRTEVLLKLRVAAPTLRRWCRAVIFPSRCSWAPTASVGCAPTSMRGSKAAAAALPSSNPQGANCDQTREEPWTAGEAA